MPTGYAYPNTVNTGNVFDALNRQTLRSHHFFRVSAETKLVSYAYTLGNAPTLTEGGG